MAASKRAENTISVAIGMGIGVEIAVAIGCMGLQKPIATATPIPMIATQSEHDLSPDPHLLIKCPPIYELISISIQEESEEPANSGLVTNAPDAWCEP